MRVFIFLLMLFGATGAWAQRSYSVTPSFPKAEEPLRLRVDSTDGCEPFVGFDLVRNGAELTVNLHETDIGPCQPQWNTPLFFPIGRFSPGSYSVKVFACGNVPPPEPACTYQATLDVTVSSARAVRAVPAVEGVVVALIALAVVLVGCRRPH